MRTLSTRGGRLALCVLLAGCGSRGYRADDPAGGDAADCDGAAPGAAAGQALLRVGCAGELLPGRASWSVEGGVVTLEFGAGAEDGPVGADLVRTWPPLGEPPWLGHRVEGIVVEGDRVRVDFAAGADEPARLFADLRLSGVRLPSGEGDARDAIDARDAEVVTHHDASIEYARSLGRAVQLVAYDRLYLAVFAHGADAERSRFLAGQVARDWVGWGAPGARRASTLHWASIGERCGGGVGGGGAVEDAPSQPAISYPEGDLAARQAAERLVSAGMRGGAEADAMAELTGSAERLAVRAASGERPERAPADVAAVVVVHAGPGHPCSLHAEVLRAAAAWGTGDGAPNPHILLLGEAATFVVGKEAP